MKNVNILIAEDEVFIGKDIKFQLEEMGYKVCQIVASGEEAIRAVAIHNPDLIIMDINLEGGMDGIQAVEKIKNAFGNIPVIFLTSLTDDETFHRAKLTGPSVFLNKSFNEYELSRHIELAIFNTHQQQNMSDDYSGTITEQFVWIKDGLSYKKVPIKDVLIIKADGSYSEVITEGKSYTLSKSMREVNDRLDHTVFVKVHKSYVVNFEKIDEFEGATLGIGKHKVPIGKTYLQMFKEKLKLL